jgi:PhnB protein
MQLPKKTTAVTPHLTVRDVLTAVTFYEKAFGFTRKFMLPGAGGRIMHAEMIHEGCTIMIGPESLERNMRSPMTAGGSPVSLFVYVADVDKLHARSVAAGAKELVAPNDQFFGARTTVVLDPDGHQWMFAQHKKEVSVEDMTKAVRGGHV